jgi:starch phosphorylase
VERDEDLKGVLDLVRSGHFNQCEPGIFDMILNAMLSPNDPWMTIADFRSYVDAQEKVAQIWQDPTHWTQMSIMNTASSGFFSTDRTMQEYNRDIWKLTPTQG